MTKGECTILDLALPALASQLLDRLNHQKNSTHTGMVGGQSAAVGIDREFTAQTNTTVLNIRPAFPFLTKPQAFEGDANGNGEGVINHGHIKVAVTHPGPRHSFRAGLLGRRVGNIAHPGAGMGAGLCRTQEIDGLLSEITRPRSAEVTTRAPPPSEIMQQSRRCSGEDTSREARTSSTLIRSRNFACGFSDACLRVVTAISASCSLVVPNSYICRCAARA